MKHKCTTYHAILGRKSTHLSLSGKHQMEAVSEIEETIRKLRDLPDLHYKHVEATKYRVTETVSISKEHKKGISRPAMKSAHRIEDSGAGEIALI